LFAALSLIVLIMCIIAANVSAKDYSKSETSAEKMLLDPAYNMGILSADVSINTQRVTFNCITDISSQDPDAQLGQFWTFLGGTLAIYKGLVNAAPEVGDLFIVVKNNNQPTVTTLSCPKSWVKDIDTNEDAINELMMNVFQTMKEA
jgi:hypothetical protein